MMYECRLVFHDKTLFEFSSKQTQINYQESEQYAFVFQAKRTTIHFFDEDEQIFQLQTRNVQSNPLMHGQKQLVLYSIPEKKGADKREVATVKGSTKCLRKIADLTTKNKLFKSCLAFVPSQVEHISILSGQSSQQKYRGFLNLIGVMFIILNVRNIIDNFIKYGVQFHNNPGQFVPIHTVFATGGLFLFPVFALLIQKVKFLKVLPLALCKILLRINILMELLYNILYCRIYSPPPIVGLSFTGLSVVICLKMISYLQVNSQLFNVIQRLQTPSTIQFSEIKQQNKQPSNKKSPKKKISSGLKRKPSKLDIEKYVFNHYEISEYNLKIIEKYEGEWDKIISFDRLFYFLFAPTLCYQIQYPRTSMIRKSWLIKRILEFMLVTALQILLWFQYINPELSNIYKTLIKDDYTYLEIFNRHLRLAVPNTIMWIAGFYNFFHLSLNITAEILRYSDRNFYMDWWNCRTLEEYWKTWNLPVHFWFIRHVYNPLQQRGYSKLSANLIVFLISAVLHEYAVSVPLKLVTWWAFLAMLSQVPVIVIQKKFGKILMITDSELGNVSFWVFFCFVGQPIVVFIYYALYMKYNSNYQLISPIPLDIPIEIPI